MKKGFTIIEVSILFVIFLIVAFLVAPLSIDDTIQAKNTSRWRSVQSDFSNIIYSIYSQYKNKEADFNELFETTIKNEFPNSIKPYNLNYLNGKTHKHNINNFKLTQQKATIAYEIYNVPKNDVLGILIYDVNGAKKPNTWGKDVFGYNIYVNRLQPFGQDEPIYKQKQDCSKNGTGTYCSNYYIIGGNFD